MSQDDGSPEWWLDAKLANDLAERVRELEADWIATHITGAGTGNPCGILTATKEAST